MTGWIESLRRLRRSETGLTVAEVMIAALILAISSLAVLNLVASGARTNYRAEQSQVVSDRLQQEVENIKQLADNADYQQIALAQAPVHSNDLANPDNRVSGTTYNVSRGGNRFQSLVFDPGGVAPATRFDSGDVTGTIHRYVVWEPDSTCTNCKKRVIVSIALDPTAAGGAVRRYQEIQAVIADPRQPSDTSNPIPPGPNDPKPWTFWLTDTPCNQTDRQPIIADHLTHNTNGVCSAGVKNSSQCSILGCPPGAPDLMVSHPPVLTSESPLYNFATDVASPDPSQDKGLRTLRPSSNTCLPSLFQPLTNILTGLLQNDGDATRGQSIHKWLTPPMPSGINVQLYGRGTLNLWTRSVGSTPYQGRLCIWLFHRHLNLLGVPVDTPATNLNVDTGILKTFDVCDGSSITGINLTYFQCTVNPWPNGRWHELSIPLHFDLSVITPGSQLGMAIQVQREGTSGGGLQYIYDEPSYESRLEVKSSSLLPCGTDSWPPCGP